MDAITYDRPEEGWNEFHDEPTATLPGRPRRQWLNLRSAALFAVVLGAVGFYVGVRVEKSQLPSSSSSAGALSGLGAVAASRGGAAGGSRAASAGAAGTGAGGLSGLRGLGGGGAAGGATFGTVSSISGNTLYVTDASGNTIKVKLSGATRVTKNVTVGKKAVRPGDTVVVQGAKGSNGNVSATTVSDTGARAAFAGAGAGAGSGAAGAGSGSAGGGNAASAVKSLFGGG